MEIKGCRSISVWFSVVKVIIVYKQWFIFFFVFFFVLCVDLASLGEDQQEEIKIVKWSSAKYKDILETFNSKF